MKEKLQVTKMIYDFNDGSRVMCTHAEDDKSAHGLFDVSIRLPKRRGKVKVIKERHYGPASSNMARHWLKMAKKEWKYE